MTSCPLPRQDGNIRIDIACDHLTNTHCFVSNDGMTHLRTDTAHTSRVGNHMIQGSLKVVRRTRLERFTSQNYDAAQASSFASKALKVVSDVCTQR